jgi:hypothetical protein
MEEIMNRASKRPTEMPPFDVAAYARRMTAGEPLSSMPPCLVPVHEKVTPIELDRPRAIAALLQALLVDRD